MGFANIHVLTINRIAKEKNHFLKTHKCDTENSQYCLCCDINLIKLHFCTKIALVKKKQRHFGMLLANRYSAPLSSIIYFYIFLANIYFIKNSLWGGT